MVFLEAATGYNAMVRSLSGFAIFLIHNSSQMDVTWVGEDITDGLIGSIAVGLNL